MKALARTIVALCCLAALGSAAAAKSRALVVGINLYPEIRENGVRGARDLRGAVNDARNMQAALIEHLGVRPEEIRLLTDAEASREGILSAFRTWLIDGTEPGDRVFFYFAGHGAQVPDEDGDESDGFDEALAPADAAGELVGSEAGLSGFIIDDEISVLLAQLAGREVTMIVDACHSGTITRGALEVRQSGAAGSLAGQGLAASGGYSGVRTLTPNGPLGVSRELEQLSTRSMHRSNTRLIEVVGTGEAAAHEPQLVAWTAVASAQLAMEDLELGGSEGLFTNRFVKGIAEGAADLNGNGRVSAAELLAFLRAESEEYCTKFGCGPGGVTPTLEAWEGYDGEVFAEYAAPRPEQPYGASIASSDELPEQGYAVAGGVSVSLTGGSSLNYGDPLRIRVDSAHSGHFVILDVRDDGTTVQLFPNSPSLRAGTRLSIDGGETRFLPGDEDTFRLVPDARGSGRIVALVIDPRVAISKVTDQYLDLAPIPSPEAYVSAISRELNRTVTYPAGSEEALYQPAAAATLARGEAAYVIR